MERIEEKYVIVHNKEIIVNELLEFLFIDYSESPIIATPFYKTHLMN